MALLAAHPGLSFQLVKRLVVLAEQGGDGCPWATGNIEKYLVDEDEFLECPCRDHHLRIRRQISQPILARDEARTELARCLFLDGEDDVVLEDEKHYTGRMKKWERNE